MRKPGAISSEFRELFSQASNTYPSFLLRSDLVISAVSVLLPWLFNVQEASCGPAVFWHDMEKTDGARGFRLLSLVSYREYSYSWPSDSNIWLGKKPRFRLEWKMVDLMVIVMETAGQRLMTRVAITLKVIKSSLERSRMGSRPLRGHH
jgi:hypothetical protein